MRAVVQRVRRASVGVVDSQTSELEIVGAIGSGLCVFVGVTHDDTPDLAERLADKLWNLRIFDDEHGVMNRSSADRSASPEAEQPNGAEMLIVSQFTLYGDTTRGRRPSWIAAARPDVAEPLIEAVVESLRSRGARVATGRFRTEMRVELVNDGPVTVMVEV